MTAGREHAAAAERRGRASATVDRHAAPSARPPVADDPRRPPTAAQLRPPTALAIPGYDALSASQVVERLAGLSGDELAAVREYETGHRRRRTILGKIEQLSA